MSDQDAYKRVIRWQHTTYEKVAHAYLTCEFDGKSNGFGDALCRAIRIGSVETWKSKYPRPLVKCPECIVQLRMALSGLTIGEIADAAIPVMKGK